MPWILKLDEYQILELKMAETLKNFQICQPMNRVLLDRCRRFLVDDTDGYEIPRDISCSWILSSHPSMTRRLSIDITREISVPGGAAVDDAFLSVLETHILCARDPILLGTTRLGIPQGLGIHTLGMIGDMLAC